MQLYYTPNSPYARVARVAARISGLDQVTEIEAKTRQANTEFFQITPLARVPTLVDGDTVVAETRDICAYFDQITGVPRWLPPEDETTRFQRHVLCGLMDGVAVWLRENGRPDGQKSTPVIAYEEHRAERILTWIETQYTPPPDLTYAALVLACTVDIALDRGMGTAWANHAPKTVEWAQAQSERPEMHATRFQPLMSSAI
ncbi:MAG: glutathione S-transferase family protein [Pelagimonas sp.]|jgi:glutathione S-transferase|nr:glutathione S-transferase family protein [Pelagimonas sp.]